MSDAKFYSLFTIAIIGILGLAGWFMFSSVQWVNDYRCHSRWEAKFEPQYNWGSGCTIIIDGQRLPSSVYRVL